MQYITYVSTTTAVLIGLWDCCSSLSIFLLFLMLHFGIFGSVCFHVENPRLPNRVCFDTDSREFPGGSDGKASAYKAGDPGSIPELGRSPGEGNDNPLQYSCLENPMDWSLPGSSVHGVAKSWTQLSDFTSLQESYKRIQFSACTNG